MSVKADRLKIKNISRRRMLCTSILVSAMAIPSVAKAQDVAMAQNLEETAQQEDIKKLNFNIPPQNLKSALVQFARKTGMELFFRDDLVANITAPAVQGNFTKRSALTKILKDTGLVYSVSGQTITLQKKDDSIIRLAPVRIQGTSNQNISGIIRDETGHEDVYFQDFSTSYLGKKEIERFRGTSPGDMLKGMVSVHSGDSRNSGAIDPSIRGVSGPGRVPVIIDGTEQALTVYRGYNGVSNRSYIDPSLIAGMQVHKGPTSARNVNGSTGGALVIKTLGAGDILKGDDRFGVEFKFEGGNNSTKPRIAKLLTGIDYRTLPKDMRPRIFNDPNLKITPRTDKDNKFFSVGDHAARLAVAGRFGKVDLFAAYAYRTRGNYFTGKSASDYYAQEDLADSPINFIRRKMAKNFKPGNEIPNTSATMESLLFKGTVNISDEQVLEFSYRDSQTENGEIMPSRIIRSQEFGASQWPLSNVHAKAYNGEYKWSPESKWVNIKANIWGTRTANQIYSLGGAPNDYTTKNPIISNSSLGDSQNNRIGFNLSNKIELNSKVDIFIEGNWHHEKLYSNQEYTALTPEIPRAGRREEFNTKLRAEWRPVSFLKINAGVSYSGYWSYDDFRSDQIKSGKIVVNGQDHSKGREVASYTSHYRTEGFGESDYRKLTISKLIKQGIDPNQPFFNFIVMQAVRLYMMNPQPFIIENDGPDWVSDKNLRYSRASNPCLNGTIKTIDKYVEGSCKLFSKYTNYDITVDDLKHQEKRWAPHLSVTTYLNENSRIYLRYAEAYRYPSLFETTIGFSAKYNPLRQNKPEHLFAYEASYIQDLKNILNLETGQYADFKITYYHNITHDVIERDVNFKFENLERQTIAGIELQARYDNGRFFTNFSASHMTKNEVCDESFAVRQDPQNGSVANCMKYGFTGGYLLTQATPENTINLTIGGRFFNRKLEIGGRLTYYSVYKNDVAFKMIENGHSVGGFNVPYTWGAIVTLDAFASYKFTDQFSIDFSGTNLNNRYYMDPLSRALAPAPGRAFRMTLTGRF